MKSCTVKMKSGLEYSGVVWDWRPTEGWMSLGAVDGEDGLVIIRFDDVESGTRERSVVSAEEAKTLNQNPTEDLLEYARKQGWVPKELVASTGVAGLVAVGVAEIAEDLRRTTANLNSANEVLKTAIATDLQSKAVAALYTEENDFDRDGDYNYGGLVRLRRFEPEIVSGFVKGASNETGVQVSGFRKEE